MFRKMVFMVSMLFLIFLLMATTQPALSKKADINSIATIVTNGAGKVGRVYMDGIAGPVFVFEEFHTSKIGQLQIALILNRLHDQYGLTTIGLEGLTKPKRPLDATWFQKAGGPQAEEAKQDVAVHMLADGEINAAELMALLYSDVKVYGLEKASEYNIRLDTKTSPQLAYLMAISEKMMTNSQILKVNQLIEEKKIKEAIGYMMSCNQWTQKMYKAITNSSSSVSIEQIIKQNKEIQNKAEEMNVQVDAQTEEDMGKTVRFFETAENRSHTMVARIIELCGKQSPNFFPVAMLIGAAHTDSVLKQLQSKQVSFVQITPLALNPDIGSLSLEEFERKNLGKWAQIGPGTLGGILNANRKSSPIIESATAQSYASMQLASILIAEAAKAGIDVPKNIWSQLETLPGIRIDRASFERDGNDVIFRAWLNGTDNTEKEVWARVGAIETAAGAAQKQEDLEGKLFRAIEAEASPDMIDTAGGSRVPPRKPPSKSRQGREGELGRGKGSGEGKMTGVTVTRLNKKVLATYADKRETVVSVGRVSG